MHHGALWAGSGKGYAGMVRVGFSEATCAHPGLIVTKGWHVKALWATVRLLEPYLGISGVNTGTDLLSKMPNVDLERGAAGGGSTWHSGRGLTGRAGAADGAQKCVGVGGEGLRGAVLAVTCQWGQHTSTLVLAFQCSPREEETHE